MRDGQRASIKGDYITSTRNTGRDATQFPDDSPADPRLLLREVGGWFWLLDCLLALYRPLRSGLTTYELVPARGETFRLHKTFAPMVF